VTKVNELTETEKAYLAGLVDGEGCISITKNKPARRSLNPNYYVQTFVVNTDERVIRYCQETTGVGSVTFFPISKKKPKHKDQWTWCLRSASTVDFLKQILPYMIVKKRQAELLIEFYEGDVSGINSVTEEVLFRREHYYQIIKDLKHMDGSLKTTDTFPFLL
jgi:hypothetical protein